MGEKKTHSKAVICLSTVAKKKDAERIAAHLVEKRLAACVNIVPGLVSHYVWKGKACRQGEFLLVMKTLASRAKRLERALVAIHPYEVPEFLILPAAGGSVSYLEWIRKGVC